DSNKMYNEIKTGVINKEQMRRTLKLISPLLVVLIFFVNTYLQAQEKRAVLSLEDIYKNGTYEQKRFGPVRWMKDNQGYSTLENDKEFGGSDIVRYDASSGKRTVLVSAKKLIPGNETKPLSIANYEWSDNDGKLLIFTNTRRVWRYNTRGDYWVLNLKTGKLQQVGKNVEPTTLMFAKFSPDASKVAYVSKQNIYVEELSTGMNKQITF